MPEPNDRKLKVILTGATGMVGEGVLLECLQHADVENVLVINRRPCNVSHPKLKEIIHKDFFNLSPVQQHLKGYNACFFCLGVSSVGMNEQKYKSLTFDLTMHFAEMIVMQNKSMVFCYISGAGTDSTEHGRSMWARVKGKTENQLSRLPFKQVYNFRPAALVPTKGMKNILPYYKYFGWLFPVVRAVSPNYVCTLKELGKAMINASIYGYDKQIVEVKDIRALAKL